MARSITLAKADEIPAGKHDVFEVEGTWIAVFNVDDTYYAIEDVCTHDGYPLEDGEVIGCEIICSRHGARFDLRNGKALTMPAVTATKSYPVRVEGDDLVLELED